MSIAPTERQTGDEVARRRLAGAQAVARQRATDPPHVGDEPAPWAATPWMVLDRWAVYAQFAPLLSALARRQLPYTDDDMCHVVACLGKVPQWDTVPARVLL